MTASRPHPSLSTCVAEAPWLRAAALSLAVAYVAGCSAQPAQEPAGDSSAEGTDTGVVATTDTGPGDDNTDGSSSSSSSSSSTTQGTTDDGTEGGALADGIRITAIEANQGVGVPIAAGTEWIGAEDRNARLMRDRGTLIRVEYEVDDDWVAIDVEAVLELDNGGEVSERRRTLSVAGDSVSDDLASQFSFWLEPEDVVPGLQFRVRLEDPSGDGVTANDEAVSPSALSQVGFEDVTSELAVVFATMEVDGCAAPVLDDALLEHLTTSLFELNPLQTLDVEVRAEPIVVPDGARTCFDAVAAAGEARAADAVPDSTLFVALYDPECVPDCLGCLSLGIGGRALIAPATAGAMEATEEAVEHCTGLALGRRHVLCNGDEGGSDPAYPYRGGDIGVYGYARSTDTLYPPTTKSYLSFCAPAWVSDYGWNQTFDLLQGG